MFVGLILTTRVVNITLSESLMGLLMVVYEFMVQVTHDFPHGITYDEAYLMA
jgi:hypothetical protein